MATAALVVAVSGMSGCFLWPVDRPTPDWEVQPSLDWYASDIRQRPITADPDEVVAWPIGIRTVDNGGYVDIAFVGKDAAQAASLWSNQLHGAEFDKLFQIKRLDGDRRTPTFGPRPWQFHHVGVASILMVSGQFEQPVPSATPDPACFILGVPLYSAAGWPAGRYTIQFTESKSEGTQEPGQHYRLQDTPEHASDLQWSDGRFMIRVFDAADLQLPQGRVLRLWRQPCEVVTRTENATGNNSAPN